MARRSTSIEIAGAGPAGSCAALAALSEGAEVRLHEKSASPRHKVCGEFLSPEIRPAFESLGVWGEFQKANPASINSVKLHFGRRETNWKLPEPAFGLSRRRLDQLLLDYAVGRGAEIIHKQFSSMGQTEILAYGRRGSASKGNRVFGFKAHFTGPTDDAVELFFRSRSYVGVSSVEDGITNVCGLAPESELAESGFDVDRFIQAWAPLRARLAPLVPVFDWMTVGPLVFGFDHSTCRENQYRTGDALGFVDPFTGSGILSAIITGSLAGAAAAQGIASSHYRAQCARVLRTQYFLSGIARFAIFSGIAENFAGWLPGGVLFSLTRPRLALK